MKTMFMFVLCLLILLPIGLFAQTTDALLQLQNLKFATSDSLTSTYSAFVHVNWAQAGVGIQAKNFMLMYNTTVIPDYKNYRSDRSLEYLSSRPDATWDIKYKYDTIMVGYMIRMTNNIYPYAGTGTVVKTDMLEVHDATDSPDVYTVKGKNATYATGIVGFIYTMPRKLTIEACLQINPLIPFIGIGYRL